MFQFAVHFQHLLAYVVLKLMWQLNVVKCNGVLSCNQLCVYTVKVQHLRVKFLARTVVLMSSIVQIQINRPTRCNNFSSLLLDIYLQLNMFRASSRPSSGAQQLQ